jgi:uridine kinase
VEPADVIIVEGILVFTCKELRDQMNIKIYVDADDDDRLMRIMSRDISWKGARLYPLSSRDIQRQ